MTTPVGDSQDNATIFESISASGKATWDTAQTAGITCYKKFMIGFEEFCNGASSVAKDGYSFIASKYDANPRISQVALGTIALGGAALAVYALRGYLPANVRDMLPGTSNNTPANS